MKKNDSVDKTQSKPTSESLFALNTNPFTSIQLKEIRNHLHKIKQQVKYVQALKKGCLRILCVLTLTP